MGADYSSNAIIGVRIRNPLVPSKRRGCRHAEQSSRFCSECGKVMWEAAQGLHPKLDELGNSECNTTGLQCCVSTDDREYFVGLYMACSGSSNCGIEAVKADLPPMLNLEEIKAKLMEYLGDLYNEKEFGLWTVLHCSY